MNTAPSLNTPTPGSPNATPRLSIGDRVVGVALGAAVGDALGAPFEFQAPLPAGAEIEFVGGGVFGWAPGEWTDDTQMAICIANGVLSTDAPLTDIETLDAVVSRFVSWARSARDVGSQTSSVLATTNANGGTSTAARAAADAFTRKHPGHVGTGALMRTWPVALATLDRTEVEMRQAAAAIAALTHAGADAVEGCVLWCAEIRSLILGDGGGLNATLADPTFAPAARRDVWATRVAAAERSMPWEFPDNGRVVHAFQSAWSAVTHSSEYFNGIRLAVRCGNDTDTVAAIAGGVLGAKYGASGIPSRWVEKVHGWPQLDADGLSQVALDLARGGR